VIRKLTITEAQEQLLRLPQEFEKDPDQTIIVTTRGERQMAILSMEAYEGLIETLESLNDPEAMTTLKASLADIVAGRVYDLEAVAAELGIEL